MRIVVAVAAVISAVGALAACKKGQPGVLTPQGGGVITVIPSPACEERMVGQVLARSTAVDADLTSVYWLAYDDGTLQRRMRGGGAIETLVTWPGEHLSESMRVANGYVWWVSKTTNALYRLPLDGGTLEELTTTGQMLVDVEVVGDIAYATDFEGHVLWWRSPGETDVLTLGTGDLSIAATPDALMVGSDHGIYRIASPGAGATLVQETRERVEHLTVGLESTYWIEHDTVMRGSDAGVVALVALEGYAVLAAAPGGVYVGHSNVVYWIADGATEMVPLAVVPAGITDLEVRGESLFVGTDAGSVHELCVDPASPAELAARAPCDADHCTWFDSGPIESRWVGDGAVLFYADGTPRRGYFADGSPATAGASWTGD